MPTDADQNPFDAAVDLDGPLVQALQDMPVPMWLADRVGRIRWLNRAAADLVGPAAGSHFARYIAPEHVADARELFARKLEGRCDAAIQRTSLLTPAGAVSVELTSVPIRDGGEVVGVIALLRDEVPASDVRRRPKPRLTPRQHEVLELLAHGRSTAEIAERLQIAEDTVRNHVRYLLAELRVRTRLEAVVVAFRNDWL